MKYRLTDYVNGKEEIFTDRTKAEKRLIALWDSKMDDEKVTDSKDGQGGMYIMHVGADGRLCYDSDYHADVPYVLFEHERYKEARDYFEEEFIHYLNAIEDNNEHIRIFRIGYADDIDVYEVSDTGLDNLLFRLEE